MGTPKKIQPKKHQRGRKFWGTELAAFRALPVVREVHRLRELHALGSAAAMAVAVSGEPRTEQMLRVAKVLASGLTFSVWEFDTTYIK